MTAGVLPRLRTICAYDKLCVDDFGVYGTFRWIKMLQNDLLPRIMNIIHPASRARGESHIKLNQRTFTGRALGPLSSSSDFESSSDVGTIGRSTTTPCAFMESKKMDSMAP